MLADDCSAAHVEGRGKPAIDAESLAAGGGADDIDDGVDRADFVEVDFLDGNGMNGGFGFAEKLKGADGAGSSPARTSGAERMMARMDER